MSCKSGNDGNIVFGGKILLAKEYLKKTGEPTINPVGWWASEKYDGYRAIWNGNHFVSRSGKKFNVPEWFSALMPPDVSLDGEFWIGRGCFEECGIFRRKQPITEEWIGKKVLYKVFDIPNSSKNFEERLDDLKRIISSRCDCMVELELPEGIVTVRCPLEITRHVKIVNEEHLDEMFKDVVSEGGEGLMIRQPRSLYEGKRSKTLLKMKVAFDTECIITGYNPGTGKYDGKLGSFKCQIIEGAVSAGKQFNVSGMNDVIRSNYLTSHPIGTRITIAFNDYTKDGIPRFPRYLRKREDI
jgi:DNA ligase 1